MVRLLRWPRVRFNIRHIFLLVAVVAVCLHVSIRQYPAWKRATIEQAFVELQPSLFWWPNSWRVEYASLTNRCFNYSHSLEGCFPDGRQRTNQQNTVDSLRDMIAVAINPDGRQDIRHTVLGLLPPKVRWSATRQSFDVFTTGGTHQEIHSFLDQVRIPWQLEKRREAVLCPACGTPLQSDSRSFCRRRCVSSPPTRDGGSAESPLGGSEQKTSIE